MQATQIKPQPFDHNEIFKSSRYLIEHIFEAICEASRYYSKDFNQVKKIIRNLQTLYTNTDMA